MLWNFKKGVNTRKQTKTTNHDHLSAAFICRTSDAASSGKQSSSRGCEGDDITSVLVGAVGASKLVSGAMNVLSVGGSGDDDGGDS